MSKFGLFGRLNIQIVPPLQALLMYKFTHVHHTYYIDS